MHMLGWMHVGVAVTCREGGSMLDITQNGCRAHRCLSVCAYRLKQLTGLSIPESIPACENIESRKEDCKFLLCIDSLPATSVKESMLFWMLHWIMQQMTAGVFSGIESGMNSG